MSKNDNHLPVYGVGPYLVAPVIITAITGLILTVFSYIPKYDITFLNWLFLLLGILLIIYGAILWISAVKSRIDDKIKSNTLETSGVYALVRHPIYSAFLYASTGLILISNNIYLFVLPVIYWAFLTVILKNTEEKWLIDLYGDDYIKYSNEVNRFIPKVI